MGKIRISDLCLKFRYSFKNQESVLNELIFVSIIRYKNVILLFNIQQYNTEIRPVITIK